MSETAPLKDSRTLSLTDTPTLRPYNDRVALRAAGTDRPRASMPNTAVASGRLVSVGLKRKSPLAREGSCIAEREASLSGENPQSAPSRDQAGLTVTAAEADTYGYS